MLELVDASLESYFRASVPLSATDVDVSFDAPDREWSAKLTRATVNAFLWDIRRSADHSQAGISTEIRNGTRVHQPALPVVELRYVVTAWTRDLGDERELLSGLTRSLLATTEIPREFLPDGYSRIPEPRLTMARAGEDHMDVFKALEGKVKPGLNLVVTTDFETGVAFPAGPPVGGITLGTRIVPNGKISKIRRVAGEVVDAVERGAVGAVVRGPTDASRVNAAGQFLLQAEEGDEIVLEVDPPIVQPVPTEGGLRFEAP